MAMDIPVYLIAGFLDSGKTSFINGVLMDDFASQGRTLLISCEDGEEEYNKKYLKNVTVISLDEEDELNTQFILDLEKKYRPTQVIMEFNGMWSLARLATEVLPDNWILYQIVTFVQASTFEVYAANMGQIMMEKIQNADMIIFNRCTPELKTALRKRNLRMVNRRAEIYLENMDGTSENYLTGNETPFDMTKEVIDVPDDDYGVWFVDAMDHPERYAGKKVHMKMVVCHSKQLPGVCCPGRFAMVCCAEDVTFLGVVAKGDELKKYKNHDWIEVTAEIKVEKHRAYRGKGPVLYMLDVKPCEKLKNDIVSF